MQSHYVSEPAFASHNCDAIECEFCGFPFDNGEPVLTLYTGDVPIASYCGRGCADADAQRVSGLRYQQCGE